MGSGVWSVNTYSARASQRGGQDAFAYSNGATGVHPSLNPYGLEVRESRDSAEHPDSNSIMIGLDVTGSMGNVIRAIHSDLPQLLGLLLDRGYVPHPQIMFSAFSNGSCNPVAVQVGQFESDNRMDMHLENMIISGPLAGGCDSRESAELMFYLAANHTSIDCWEKRKRKGYLFVITDEPGYDKVRASEIQQIFNRKLSADIPFDQMVAQVKERFHVFVIIPTETSAGSDAFTHQFWRSYLTPQNVILLNHGDDVSETIALAIGLTERTITLEQGLEHLRKAGTAKERIDELDKSLSVLDVGGVKGAGTLKSDDDSGQRGTKRL